MVVLLRNPSVVATQGIFGQRHGVSDFIEVKNNEVGEGLLLVLAVKM